MAGKCVGAVGCNIGVAGGGGRGGGVAGCRSEQEQEKQV